MEAYLVCFNKECPLYYKSSEKEKCPKCGGELKCSDMANFGHANIALCETCNQYWNTMMDFKECHECNSERWFIDEKDLIK